jgi:hypothetical protein
MRPQGALAAALACAIATAAGARDRPAPGGGEELSGVLALRAGVALPAGSATKGVLFSDALATGALPLGVELGARGTNTTLGVEVEWGRSFVPSCPAGQDCAGSVWRAGLEVLYRLSPESRASTWLGVGMGYEGTTLRVGDRSTRLDSFELLNLQLGRDVALGRGVLLGPFVAATFAQGMTVDGKDVQDKSPHAWLQLGLRAELR